jgi:hypothetical protein
MATEYEAEIWLVPADGGQPKWLAEGAYPHWTDHSTRLYFHSRVEGAVCCLDITNPLAEPTKIASCDALYPAVSPDEQYLAYAMHGQLSVIDLSSEEELATWVVPGPEKYCCVQWSPDGKEISLSVVGMRNYSSGLWIFDCERREGWHLLDAEAIRCNWSRDRSRVAFDVFFPVSEIWTARVDPNVPTCEALAPLQSRGEYLRSYWPRYVASYERAWSTEKETVLENLTAVGVNQYQYEQYEDALWTLQQVAELRRSRDLPADVQTDAYVAMALYRMGRCGEATEVLRRLRLIRAQPNDRSDVVYLQQAETLFGDPNSSAP